MRSIVHPVAVMGRGVAGGEQRPQFDRADAQGLSLPQSDVSTRQPVQGRSADSAAGEALELERASQMIGVNVGLDGAGERQPQVSQNLKVTLDGIDHRIDDRARAGVWTS